MDMLVAIESERVMPMIWPQLMNAVADGTRCGATVAPLQDGSIDHNPKHGSEDERQQADPGSQSESLRTN